MTSLSQYIQSLEQQLLTPEVRNSPERLDDLLTADFFEIGSSGRMLYEIKSEGPFLLNPVDMTLHDFMLHYLSEESVFVTYRIDDHTYSRQSLRSSIWVLQGETWKMRFHQGTVCAPN